MWNTQPACFTRIAIYGVLLGLAGGIAEVIWIALYGLMASVDTSEVAFVIDAVAQRALPGSPAVTNPLIHGIVIHMVAAVGLGVALALAWHWLARHRPLRVDEYAFMVGALTLVWAFNFFVVLPLISPSVAGLQGAFVELLPYPVSLASKVLFGLAGAAVLRFATRDPSASYPIRVSAR